MTSAASHDEQGRRPEAHLLVVDDEPNILELLATSLRFAGFQVTTAADGRQALAAARRECPTSWCST